MPDRKQCRHCGKNVAARSRRGLCHGCLRTPEIRARYPKQATYLLRQGDPGGPLTDAEIEAIPALAGDMRPAGKRRVRYVRPEKPEGIGATAANWSDIFMIGKLTPDTEPEAIASAQRKVVKAALKRGVHHPARISEAVALSEWVVRRRLKELRRR